MTGTEGIKQAMVWVAAEAAKTTNGESRRPSISLKQNGVLKATRHRTGPSLRKSGLNLDAKEKYMELRNFIMEIINI